MAASLHQTCTLQGLTSARSASAEAISRYDGLHKRTMPRVLVSRQRNAPLKLCRSTEIKAAFKGTQIARFSKKKAEEGDESEKPKFGTQTFLFGRKADDEEESEESTPAKKLSLVASPFSGIQAFGRRTDSKTVFVAGATGQTGSRITLQLLNAGFNVRAGVSDIQQAQQLAEVAADYGLITPEEARRLNVVEFSSRDPMLTAKAIGSASKLVVTIGKLEDGPKGTLSAQDVLGLVEAADLAKIPNIVVVTKEGGAGASSEAEGGFFQKILAFFRGNAEKGATIGDVVDRIVESNFSYTIVETGSTAGVPDTLGGGLEISPEGSVPSLQKVSKLQVGQLVATIFSDVAVAENKYFQVAASSSAAVADVIEQISSIPVDSRRAELAEARAKAEADEREQEIRRAAEEEAARVAAEAREAVELAASLEAEAKRLLAEEARISIEAAKAQARADAATASVTGLAEKVSSAGGFSEEAAPSVTSPIGRFGLGPFKLGKKQPEVIEEEEEEEEITESTPKVPGFGIASFAAKLTAKAGGDEEEEEEDAGEKLKLPVFAFKQSPAPPAPKPAKRKVAPKPQAPKPRSPPSNPFGGLFKQETVYSDSRDAGDF